MNTPSYQTSLSLAKSPRLAPARIADPHSDAVAILLLALTAVLATLLLLTAGCKADERQSSNSEVRPAAATAIVPTLDQRSQYDLAKALAQVEKLSANEADFGYDQVRRDWQGKRFRWQVFRIPAMCPSAERCNVIPFDLAGSDHKKVVQGWLPRLQLSPESFDAIADRCTGQSRCSIEFEGTLSQLVLSTEHLTALRFSDIRVL